MDTAMQSQPSSSPVPGGHYDSLAQFWVRAHRAFVYVSEPGSGIQCGASVEDASCKTCATTGQPVKTPSSCSYAAAMPDDSVNMNALHTSPVEAANKAIAASTTTSSSSSCPVAVVSDSGESLHPLTRMPMALYTEDTITLTTPTTTATKKRSWWSWSRSPDTPAQPPSPASPSPPSPPGTSPTANSQLPLGEQRQQSTIPMAKPPDGAQLPQHQQGVVDESKDGHQVWMYPSEQMFYKAMQRKGWQPEARDMNTVVRIHNAVNERAWQEVCAWESLHCAECPQGPRLARFQGRPSDLSPRARFLNLIGYAPPFDRHDWVVDRCGKQVRYIIDFYAGVPPPGGPPAAMWLDTRPALDSFEAAWDRLTVSVSWVLGSIWPMGPNPNALPHPSYNQQNRPQTAPGAATS